MRDGAPDAFRYHWRPGLKLQERARCPSQPEAGAAVEQIYQCETVSWACIMRHELLHLLGSKKFQLSAVLTIRESRNFPLLSDEDRKHAQTLKFIHAHWGLLADCRGCDRQLQRYSFMRRNRFGRPLLRLCAASDLLK